MGYYDNSSIKTDNFVSPQIRNWFQNRRMKLKRTVQDALAHACQANVASQLMHYPELQSFRPAPYPSFYPAQESQAPYMCPPNIHYTPSVVPTLSANALYQYRCPQGLPVTPSNPALMQPYQPYSHQYFSSQWTLLIWATQTADESLISLNEAFPAQFGNTFPEHRVKCNSECIFLPKTVEYLKPHL